MAVEKMSSGEADPLLDQLLSASTAGANAKAAHIKALRTPGLDIDSIAHAARTWREAEHAAHTTLGEYMEKKGLALYEKDN